MSWKPVDPTSAALLELITHLQPGSPEAERVAACQAEVSAAFPEGAERWRELALLLTFEKERLPQFFQPARDVLGFPEVVPPKPRPTLKWVSAGLDTRCPHCRFLYPRTDGMEFIQLISSEKGEGWAEWSNECRCVQCHQHFGVTYQRMDFD